MVPKESVIRAYRGRIGCMCGCKGRYFDEGRGLTGVLKDVNARLDKVTVAPNLLDTNQDTVSWEGDGYSLVLYVKRGTLKHTKAQAQAKAKAS